MFKVGERAKTAPHSAIPEVMEELCGQECTIVAAQDWLDTISCMGTRMEVYAYIVRFDSGMEIYAQPHALRKLVPPDQWATDQVAKLLDDNRKLLEKEHA